MAPATAGEAPGGPIDDGTDDGADEGRGGGTVGGLSFVRVAVGGVALAVPLSDVLEILRRPTLVRVPLGPPCLEGLARRHGVVFPVIALRRLLDLSNGEVTSEQGTGARVLVVRHGGLPVGLAVDRVHGLTTVAPERIADVSRMDEAPDLDGGATIDRELLAGVIRGEAGGVATLILDTGPLIERPFAELGGPGDGPVGGYGGAFVGGFGGPPAAGAVDAVIGPGEDAVRLVLFAAAGQDFALPVEAVQEIVAAPASITRMPRARAHLLGMMSLRDALLPLVGLRELFALDTATATVGSAERRVVVVRTADGLVGVVVDEVSEIRRVPQTRIDPVPPLLAREAEFEDVAGIARLDAGRLVSVLSAERLFRHGAALGIADDRRDGREEAMREEAMGDARTVMDGGEIVLVIRLAGVEFGLPVVAVREVLRRPEAPTPLPGAPDAILGVTTSRGAVLPVIDPRRLLRLSEGGHESGAGDRARVVVVGMGAAQAGLLVDGVAGMVRVPAERIEDAPALSLAQRRLIRRVASLDDATAEEGRRMVLLLDPDDLLDMDQLNEPLAPA